MSYKNLPYKLYEMTRYGLDVNNLENWWFKELRAFTMPDCHAFCKDIPQAVEEVKVRFDLSKSVLKELGIDESDFEMAIRFTEDFYNENKSDIEELVKKHGRPVLVEMWKEILYFVLKWEFNFDNLERHLHYPLIK